MKPLEQQFGQVMRVLDQLGDIHGAFRINCVGGFSRAALVPLHDDEILLQQAIESNRGHLRLAGAPVELEKQRFLRAIPADQESTEERRRV